MRARRKQGRGRTENRTRVPPVSASSCVFMEFVRVGLMFVTVRSLVLEDCCVHCCTMHIVQVANCINANQEVELNTRS